MLPGLICFTPVGRLWYIPGALLLAGAAVGGADLRADARELRLSSAESWTAILTICLAGFYIFLGAAHSEPRASSVSPAGCR